MGQVASSLSHSSSSGPVSPSTASSKAAALGNAAVATGARLKRAFAARRKKTSEDVTANRSLPKVGEKVRSNEGASGAKSPPKPIPSPPSDTRSFSTNTTQVTNSTSSRGSRGSGKLTMQLALQMFGKKQAAVPHPSTSPPAPPPKPATPPKLKEPPTQLSVASGARPQRNSIIPISPGISSALQFISADEESREQDRKLAGALSDGELDSEKKLVTSEKEAWRKSDSTMSHHTIRPGAGPGNRASRPVSMAESLQSNHTVVPPSKRLSALLTEADFFMPEEEASQSSDSESPPPTARAPMSTAKANNRRSMSLNLASSNFNMKAPTSPPLPPVISAELKQSPMSPPASVPTIVKAAATGEMSSGSSSPTPGTNVHGRLVAWTVASGSDGSSRSASHGDRHKQTQHHQHHRPQDRAPALQAPSLRQTAISMTAPAAGLAKRAVEKMGRALGGMGSSASHSGYSSSSSLSGTAPSSYTNASHPEHPLTRIGSNQSGLSNKGKARRTPNAPSTGSWSVTSSMTSSSLSDSDIMPPSGPILGKCLRPPFGHGKVVFGKPLKQGVSQTPIIPGDMAWDASHDHGRLGDPPSREMLVALELKRLPALVVRCAQHILIWGVQEEGLFRVNGRPTHVSKIRSEFDSGADYDMSNCNPGDLDPHAVASVFKAYLRELPEPILTQALVPYFEAAMAQENSMQAAQAPAANTRPGMKGPSLPSGPRAGQPGVRKPPSLSTLAMPNLSGMRPPSESLLNALRSLIDQLPAENRDLVRLVTDLIKATSKASKATKMPLSNLLLVFCPSLNMSPPLLRVLCEADIWDPVSSGIIDIRRESVVLDIKPAVEKEPSETSTGSSVDSTAVVETVYLDAADHMSIGTSSASDLSSLSRDDVSYVSTSEGDSNPVLRHIPSPQLSSSVESLSTPSTSTDDRSFDDELYLKRPTRGSPIIADSTSPSPLSTSPSGRPVISSPILTAMPPTVSSPLIGSPIQFPMSSIPPSSPPQTPASRKRSFPSLSLPSFSPFSGSSSSSPSSTPSASSPTVQTTKSPRLRKPSLHLLLSKRSSSSPLVSPISQAQPGSAGSPYLQPPRAASDSSVSTPISAVTAPGSSTFTLPPVLGTQDFGRRNASENPRDEIISPPASAPRSGKIPRPLPAIPMSVTQSQPLPRPITKELTPIADRYRSGSNASLPTIPLNSSKSIFQATASLRSSHSNASLTSNHLGLLGDDGDKEDWTKSVLMAADAKSQWPSAD
ncbi:hypothetical protein ONZ45_g12878 [Pleurotus djamor]|nr:hypothetical protein ONZ45_g12878 [Pleurotus djamor]